MRGKLINNASNYSRLYGIVCKAFIKYFDQHIFAVQIFWRRYSQRISSSGILSLVLVVLKDKVFDPGVEA